MRVHICSFVEAVAEARAASGKLYRWEFSDRFGPTLVSKQGEPLLNQPMSERHEFWSVFTPWLKQREGLRYGKPKGCC